MTLETTARAILHCGVQAEPLSTIGGAAPRSRAIHIRMAAYLMSLARTDGARSRLWPSIARLLLPAQPRSTAVSAATRLIGSGAATNTFHVRPRALRRRHVIADHWAGWPLRIPIAVCGRADCRKHELGAQLIASTLQGHRLTVRRRLVKANDHEVVPSSTARIGRVNNHSGDRARVSGSLHGPTPWRSQATVRLNTTVRGR